MYMVYGKLKTDKRFKAFDMKNNVFVANLIYASIFSNEELEALKKEIDFMNKTNQQYIFEIRGKL